MITPNPAIKFTLEDYKHTPDDKRYELLDGELIMAQRQTWDTSEST